MRSVLVYDLPTRLFHWLFAFFFLISFTIAKSSDDESVVFSYHMLVGFLLGQLILWRILWGFMGSTHARFSDFVLNPIELKNYFQGLLSGSKKRWLGHNPATSWAAVIMFTLGLGLAVTGYLMGTGYKNELEDVHELMANSFLVIVLLHISGVIFHSLRHKDFIALSMLDGRKEMAGDHPSISSTRWMGALLLVIFIGLGGLYIFKNFNPEERSLRFFSETLQLEPND